MRRSWILAILISTACWGQFTPPRVIRVINQPNSGTRTKQMLDDRRYLIDQGIETSIFRGDILNVYREQRLSRRMPEPMRLFIGTMTITDSQLGSSVGVFCPHEPMMSQALIKLKTSLKNDIVVPRLILDAGVLFDPGQFALKPRAKAEFAKVARFVQLFSPAKLVIEGHTDSDGEGVSNFRLSEQRAGEIGQYLINKHAFINAAMIEARGFGESRPLVNNDTPENRALNRRIEVIVWE
jgi:flagellar motor protein MotB